MSSVDPKEFEGRGPGNVRIAWALVAVVAVIFLLALWKVRPL